MPWWTYLKFLLYQLSMKQLDNVLMNHSAEIISLNILMSIKSFKFSLNSRYYLLIFTYFMWLKNCSSSVSNMGHKDLTWEAANLVSCSLFALIVFSNVTIHKSNFDLQLWSKYWYALQYWCSQRVRGQESFESYLLYKLLVAFSTLSFQDLN